MSVVSVVRYRVEVSASDRSHVRGVLPNLVALSVIDEPHRGGLGPLGVVYRSEKDKT